MGQLTYIQCVRTLNALLQVGHVVSNYIYKVYFLEKHTNVRKYMQNVRGYTSS